MIKEAFNNVYFVVGISGVFMVLSIMFLSEGYTFPGLSNMMLSILYGYIAARWL